MAHLTRTLRRSFAIVATATAAALASSMLAGTAPAVAAPVAAPPGVSDVRIGLIHLGRALAAAAEQPALSENLPLTDLSVRNLLKLDSAIGTAVEDALSEHPDTTLDTLKKAFPEGGRLVVTDASSLPGAPAGSRDWLLKVNLTAAVPAAVTYKDDRLQFGAAELSGELAGRLSGSIRFRYDSSEVARRRFSVVGSTDLTTQVWTRAQGSGAQAGAEVKINRFTAVDGFVQLAAAGKATIDSTTVLTLRDPNGRGQITTEDFQFSSAGELFTTKTPPGADDVAMNVALTSGLDDTATGSVTVGRRAATATGPYAVPTVERNAAMEDLTALSRLQAIAGFTQYVSAVMATQSTAEQEFPLLDVALSDLYSPAQKLLDLLTEQATATIVCGAADTSPPSGAPRPGQVRYCQAISTTAEADADEPITWKSTDPDATIKTTSGGAGTVGRAPTANVEVSGGSGFPALRVSFTDTEGVEQHARSVVASIQDLQRAISGLQLDGNLSYDRKARSFEVAVRQLSAPADPQKVDTGGNGNLAPLTGLTGLCQAAVGVAPRICPQTGDKLGGSHAEPESGEARVTTKDRQFRADFGIGMTASGQGLTEGAPVPEEPVVYLRPEVGGLMYRVGSVEAELAQNAALVARIGFLQVDVDVTDYKLEQSGPAAASVSIDTSAGVRLPSKETVTGAVPVTSLLTEDGKAAIKPVATRGLRATAKLKVQDSQQRTGGSLIRPLDVEGIVTANWTDMLPQTLPTVSTEGDYPKLRLLDLVPSRQGTMGTGTKDGRIVDGSADFLNQFGIKSGASAEDRIVTRPLYDLSVEGSSSTVCTAMVVEDAHTLRCTQGPLSEANVVAPGHRYVLNGNPEALRDVLIEDLSGVLATFANPDPALKADRTFPLVDLKPSEISAARDGLDSVVADLRAQAADPDPTGQISTMQQFSTTLSTLLGKAVGGDAHATQRSVDFTLASAGQAPTRLVLTTSLDAEGKKDVPLRVAAGSSELRVLGNAAKVATLPINVASRAKIVIGVNLADATTSVGSATEVHESITGLSGNQAALKQTLAAKAGEFGSTLVTTGAAKDIQLGIGVGARTAPNVATGSWLPLVELPGKLKQVRSVVGSPQTCGAPAAGDAGAIAACLELPLNDRAASPQALPLVKVALKADESSGGSGGAAAPQPIAYRFLTDGLAGLNLTLADALDGDQTLGADGTPLSLPLVGTNLDAGADVPADVTKYVSTSRTALTALETSVKEADTAESLKTALEGALNGVNVPNVTRTKPIVVTLGCGPDGSASCDGKTVADVQRITAPLSLKGQLAQPQQVPFQVGPAGASIQTNLSVPTVTTWTLDVTVGIGRGTGPFVKLDAAARDGLLNVHVTSHLARRDAAGNTCHQWARQQKWKSGLPAGHSLGSVDVPADGAAAAECIDAFVGKLPSVLVDRPVGGARSTALDANIKVGVSPPASGLADSEGLTYLPTLYDKDVTFKTKATGDGKVSVYFESFASQSKFFDVLGTLDLVWKNGSYGSDGLQFGQLRIDVTTLNNAILPGFDKAKKWLAPLNPVVDVLSRPIPVVTELSEVVGKGPVTLLTLLQKQKTPINLVLNLLQLQNMIAAESGDGPDLRAIGVGLLGGFKVSPSRLAVGQKCTETVTRDGDRFERKSGGNGASGRCKPGALTKLKQAASGKTPPKDAEGVKIEKTSTKSPYLSLPSVSVPVLQDTSQIFNLLLDEGDATMLYVDLGHAGVSGQIVRNFGPFMVGPVPVSASIGGTVGLDGRFAFGFDTRGLSRKIETLDPGDIAGFDKLGDVKLFSDGFYIDDLENGVDVPEISLSFTVQAGAAVSIGFAEAGIQGGVTLDLSLDAFDPNGDGKIYSDEFAGASNGPDCAFNVSSGLVFFLQFYFSIDLFFFSINESFDIVRSPRIKLFEFNCEVAEPVLAVESGTGKDTILRLTMGSYASARKAYAEVKEEKYTVRQVGGVDANGKITLQVSAFNLVKNFSVHPETSITADAGDGADTVRMYPMPALTTAADGTPSLPDPSDPKYVAPRFTAKATILGGAGADTVVTGDGDDRVEGGPGNDSLNTGAGKDTVRGDDGNDQLDGGQGQDDLAGGAGNDRILGGPGADQVRGDGGDDVLDGGSGASPEMLFPTADANDIRPLLDAGDLVVGGDGSDSVTGGDGSDIAVGGSYDPKAEFAETASLQVYGLDQLNRIQQVNVSGINTIILPTLAEVRAQCATPGTDSGTGRDTVTGGGDRDYVIGGKGADTLSGGAGDDVVCGRDGDDVLDGDGYDVSVELQGDDEVRGGSGADRIYGSGGKDDLHGDLGDDLVRGGDGADAINGGGGADLLLGEGGIDTLLGDGDGATPLAADATSSGREISCAATTSVVSGRIDLDGDLSGNGDTGQLEGLSVQDGYLVDSTGARFSGVVGGIVFDQGRADLDGNGRIQERTKTVLGDTGSIPLAGMTGAAGNGDCILGGDETDPMLDGQLGADYVDAGGGDDAHVHGGPGNDLVRGGDGNDTVHGDSGDDLVAGDADDDIVYGDIGKDVLRGGSGHDLLAGGSPTAGAVDGADEVLGDGGNDVVLGGNATLSRTALPNTAIAGVGVTLLATDASGADDELYGGYGDDWVFGQTGDDSAFGGPGRDVVEGGPGADRVQGDDGEDLLVGGSSTTGAVTLDRSAAGTPDGGDEVVGDEGVDGLDGSDVMVGDNARLARPKAGVGRTRWSRIRPDVDIELFDQPTVAAPDAITSGTDRMRGGGADDLILGQSGADRIDGGAGDDGIEGGAGGDTLLGGDGDDELIGGSWTAGSYDGGAGDVIDGEAGDDLLLGDNGQAANGTNSVVRLLDAPGPGALAAAATFGDDELSGGPGDDTAFGQSGNDILHGDAGDDALEGNAGADQLFGGDDDDALTGGSSSSDGEISDARSANGVLDEWDTLSGGAGDDVLAGDNARVDATSRKRADGTRLRTVLLFDVVTASTSVPSGVGTGDLLTGDEGRDLMFGQAGDDEMAGGAGDDYLQGDVGDDNLTGNEGEDDLVGGGSSNTGSVISAIPLGGDRLLTALPSATDKTASGLVDGNDTLDGGDSRDVLLGDNGRITREGPNKKLAGGASGVHVVRQVAMADEGDGPWAGSDRLHGGAGDDDLYGQFDNTRTGRPQQSHLGQPVRGDVLDGGDGDDALIGDQGIDVPKPAKALGAPNRTVFVAEAGIRERIRPSRGLVRVVTLTQSSRGGDDLVLGGLGADSIHSGAGNDVVNAGAGEDFVFGGNGHDALWGGADHDRLFGGAGNDLLDIKRRTRDPLLWQLVAPVEDMDRLKRTVNGRDILYGGSGADALQADQGDGGSARRMQGDRLIDWRSTINHLKVCTNSGYGPGKTVNKSSGTMRSALRQLAAASGSVGSAELALAPNERVTKYPNTGLFVCENR